MSYDAGCYCNELAEVDYGKYICLFCELEAEERLRRLAQNLAVGGALCRAFRLGFDEGWDVTGEGFNSEYVSPRFKWPADYEAMATNNDDGWRPGCGRQAP